MELQRYIDQKKELYEFLLDYIENTESTSNSFDKFIDCFNNDLDDFTLNLQLIINIANNHHRSPDFFSKIEPILLSIKQNIIKHFYNFRIFNAFQNNKRIILFLIENEIITLDERIVQIIISKIDQNGTLYSHFFLPEIKEFVDEKLVKTIEKEILNRYLDDFSDFDEIRKIGENNSYICRLIRQDSIQEFIQYVNRNNISLSSSITPSVFETNAFLIENNPSLIEYASFFGSIQIFQYLLLNNVELKPSLWLYAIHSNNAELIHILEGNQIKPEDKTYKKCLIESIKCHHNSIVNYIIDNLYEHTFENDKLENIISDELVFSIMESLNYSFYPNSIVDLISRPYKKKGFKISHLDSLIDEFTISSTVNSIGDYALSESSMNEIFFEYPSSVITIEDFAFSNSLLLTHISIPSSVTSIGDNAFSDCCQLKAISIPSSVKSIGKSAFYQCTMLQEFKIPSSVTTIGEFAFCQCSNLKRINIPSSLTSIEKNLFNKCVLLSEIVFEIPSSVKSIDEFAFSDCHSITQIIIPSSVKRIDKYAFYKCMTLSQISIPDSVTEIKEGAFNDCKMLKRVSNQSNITSIEENVFSVCLNLTEIEIPSSVSEIKSYAFFHCSSLKKISIPSSLKSIKSHAFEKCSSLTSIEIPSSLVEIDEYAFDSCSSLMNVSFEIPSSVKIIKKCAFYGCLSLKKITIPSSLVFIGEKTFNKCLFLTEISIPSTLNIDKLELNDKVKILIRK